MRLTLEEDSARIVSENLFSIHCLKVRPHWHIEPGDGTRTGRGSPRGSSHTWAARFHEPGSRGHPWKTSQAPELRVHTSSSACSHLANPFFGNLHVRGFLLPEVEKCFVQILLLISHFLSPLVDFLSFCQPHIILAVVLDLQLDLVCRPPKPYTLPQ